MQIIKKALYLLLLFFIVLSVNAQTAVNIDNFHQVKIDQLTDAQVRNFWQEAQSKGIDMAQFQMLAQQKGMDPAAIAKLKARIEKVSATKPLDADEEAINEEFSDSVIVSSEGKVKRSKIFGSELFSNKNLTFEPNMKIATPANYQIGPDDELIIDIYGYSDANYKLKVTPNGQIRIPSVGMVSVSGLTMDQAKAKITQQLGGIYSTIATGQTKVNVALGTLRSIRVIILGEVALPGTYTLSSLATAFNAIYASGGPNENGSFRNIKIIRGGKMIQKVDIYDFLVKGETKGNIPLRDQDIIKVEAYEARVELKGEVKRPGLYEVKDNETLKDLFRFAGGFTNEAYRDRVKVVRNTSKEKSVADVSSDVFEMFIPKSGDVYQVGKLIDRFTNRVEIRGAVFRPGFFALTEGLTVKELIEKAEGLKEDAFMSRAVIYRLREDNTGEVIAFDVAEVMGGKKIVLQREDLVEINSKLELKESYNLTILGEVLRPNTYPYAENARVEDLIVAAGGLKETAARNKIEVARRVKSEDGGGTKIIKYTVSEDLKDSSDILLQPFDIVTVYALPGYTPQRNVMIEGEVAYPGQYSLSTQKDRISDIMARSGGVNSYGNIKGAVLVRTKKLTQTDEIIRKQKVDAFIKQTKDTVRAQELVQELMQTTSIVGINLEKILKQPGGKYDLFLEDGDIIRVPRMGQTVKVSGEILYPVRIPYTNGKGLRKYVKGAGGFTARALKRKTYVVYANGSAEGTSRFLCFNIYPKLEPGAEVIVPVREEKRRMTTGEVVAITTSLTTLVLLVYTVIVPAK